MAVQVLGTSASLSTAHSPLGRNSHRVSGRIKRHTLARLFVFPFSFSTAGEVVHFFVFLVWGVALEKLRC